MACKALSVSKSEATRAVRPKTGAFSAVMAAVAVCGCLMAQQPEAPKPDVLASRSNPAVSPSSLATGTGDYLINPEDVLDVYVFEVPDISREYTVRTDGTVDFPLLPQPVQAAGLSSEQLSRGLEENFRSIGRLRHPQITVSVKQSRRSVVIVEGAVRTPQVIPLIGRSKLLYVLSEAGGVGEDAGDVVTVTRGELGRREAPPVSGSGTSTVTVDLKQLIERGQPSSNLDIFPGDRVTVERAGLVYILGQVVRPGGYVLRSRWEHLTILEALTIAGDVTSTAKKNKAMIIREDPKALKGRVEIALNLHNILVGRSPDQTLLPNDILYVPGSGGKRALHTAGNAAVTVGTAVADALIIYRP